MRGSWAVILYVDGEGYVPLPPFLADSTRIDDVGAKKGSTVVTLTKRTGRAQRRGSQGRE